MSKTTRSDQPTVQATAAAPADQPCPGCADKTQPCTDCADAATAAAAHTTTPSAGGRYMRATDGTLTPIED